MEKQESDENPGVLEFDSLCSCIIWGCGEELMLGKKEVLGPQFSLSLWRNHRSRVQEVDGEIRTFASITGEYDAIKMVWKNKSCQSSLIMFEDLSLFPPPFPSLRKICQRDPRLSWWDWDSLYKKGRREIGAPFLSSLLCLLGVLLIEEVFHLCLQEIIGVCSFIFLLCYLSHLSSPPPSKNGLVRRNCNTAPLALACNRISKTLRKL